MAERYAEGERRADYRAGVIASILGNVNRDEKKRPEPFEPGDFFPSLRPPKPAPRPPQTPEEIKNSLALCTRPSGDVQV